MSKRLIMLAITVLLVAACGAEANVSRGTSQRCSGGSGVGYTCTGTITEIRNAPTVTLGSDALMFGDYGVTVTVEVEEGEVIARFSDDNLNPVEATASPGSPATFSGDPRMFDGDMVLTFEAQGEERTARGISYEVVFEAK